MPPTTASLRYDAHIPVNIDNDDLNQNQDHQKSVSIRLARQCIGHVTPWSPRHSRPDHGVHPLHSQPAAQKRRARYLKGTGLFVVNPDDTAM